MRIKTKKIYYIELSKDFFVEAEQEEECYSFWLCRTNYGTKTYIFGLPLYKHDSLREAFQEFKPLLIDREYMDVYLECLLEGEEVDEHFNIIK